MPVALLSEPNCDATTTNRSTVELAGIPGTPRPSMPSEKSGRRQGSRPKICTQSLYINRI